MNILDIVAIVECIVSNIPHAISNYYIRKFVTFAKSRMQIQAKPMNSKRFWSSLLSNGGRKLVQMRAEPSLLELCRVQPSFCKLLQMVYRLTFSYSTKRFGYLCIRQKGIKDWRWYFIKNIIITLFGIQRDLCRQYFWSICWKMRCWENSADMQSRWCSSPNIAIGSLPHILHGH